MKKLNLVITAKHRKISLTYQVNQKMKFHKEENFDEMKTFYTQANIEYSRKQISWS